VTEIEEDKYSKKNTKIWSKGHRELPSKVNLFLDYAEKFFYPLINQNIFKLYSEDPILLSKLIDTLSIFVYCCGTNNISQKISFSLIEFVWSMRYIQNNKIVMSESEKYFLN
jgi:hypothetical protein